MAAKNGEDKHSVIDAKLRNWRQGDCCIAGGLTFVYQFAPASPLTDGAIAAAAEGVGFAGIGVLGFVVLSQTCDIVSKCSNRPFLEVAPLVSVDERHLHAIKRGHYPRYAWVPALEGRSLVADLDRVMTVEKGVVADWERIPGCRNDDELNSFRQMVVRKLTRFAFPDDFVRATSKLLNRIQGKHDRESDEGAALRALLEIRVRASPSWDSDSIALNFWFIRNKHDTHFLDRQWDEMKDRWLQLLPSGGRFQSVQGAVVTLENFSMQDYFESGPLDLDYLSMRPE